MSHLAWFSMKIHTQITDNAEMYFSTQTSNNSKQMHSVFKLKYFYEIK